MASSPNETHETRVQDFAAPASPASPTSPQEQASKLAIDTQLDGTRTRGRSATSATATAAADDDLLSPVASINTIRRRITRSHTVKKYDDYKSPTRPHWQEPGAEPGVDTKNDTEAAKYHQVWLPKKCVSTYADFLCSCMRNARSPWSTFQTNESKLTS
jgi:hypothetical protein